MLGRANGLASGSGRRRLSGLDGRAAKRVVAGGGTSGRSGGLGRRVRAYLVGCSGRRRPCELASRGVVASLPRVCLFLFCAGGRCHGVPALEHLRLPGERLLAGGVETPRHEVVG